MTDDIPTSDSSVRRDLADDVQVDAVADELAVLASVAADLETLNIAARDRVLDYLVARYQSHRPLRTSAMGSRSSRESVATQVPTDAVFPTDIRSFRESKQPANAQEMAAVLAFYLLEMVPEEDRRGTVTPADVEKYFKQAGFPLPARSRNALFNAKTAGYLEEAATRGEYKLSPVGHNLVNHRLPRSADSAAPGKAFRRRPRRSQPPTSERPDNAGLNA